MEQDLSQIKKQLIEHIQKNFPEDKKQVAIQQINSMDEEQLIQFLQQNNLIKNEDEKSSENKQQCIFCSISSKQIPSYIIDENMEAVAVLEINPVSKGHVLIIPKKHTGESGKIPPQVFALAKKISSKIKTKLNPKEVNISSSAMFGHLIINLIPVYDKENLESPRKKAKEEDLEKLKDILEKKAKPKVIRKKKPVKISEEIIRIPRRIP